MANSIIFKVFVAFVLISVYVGVVIGETFCLVAAVLVASVFGSVSAWVKGSFGRVFFVVTRAASKLADNIAFNMGEQHKVCINRYHSLTSNSENA